ncbi:MAG: peptide deformylase [Clostridiales bacterium]|nr:peptide deformylase [Clostridiales bacterium]MDO4350565.1 peptide deformylase [Eubacteriales bacterium]MDY4007240.1 peptide deformylase [Candidatus Limiplasma sp.]
MATRKIVEIGDEKLRKHCKPVEKFDLRLRILLKDMADTMYKADGVGLAAPQVGILRRAVVVDIGEGLYEMVNPEIIASEGEQTGPEACLSVPGRSGIVTRPNKVTVRAQNSHGETYEVTGEGFLARAFCHELDHLDGTLYVDKMEREIFPDEEEEEAPEGEAEE